jgi:hypothetical protein
LHFKKRRRKIPSTISCAHSKLLQAHFVAGVVAAN